MPDGQEHIAFRYLALGANIIPLQTRDKRPYLSVLQDGVWSPFQKRRVTREEAQLWIERGTQNWGLICGEISGGIYCGDVDNMEFARWVLDHARDPLLRGACIVESGSGKAHIWFRCPNRVQSGVWYLTNRAAHAGDVRGDGRSGAGPSYMVVPPSIHPDTGRAYQIRSGGFENLPTVPNGEAFLKAVGDAYLSETPVPGAIPPRANDRSILQLSDDEKTDTFSKVRGLNMKQRIKDTLLVPGNQAPGTRHWNNVPSQSEIDYAVICELIRKEQDFEAIERIFACCEIGGTTYRDKSRANHGYGYLKLTFDRARDSIEQARQAARVASGANFKVLRAARYIIGPDEAQYTLDIEVVSNTGTTRLLSVAVPAVDLLTEQTFIRKCFLQVHWTPKFLPGQRGHNFSDFTDAVSSMVEEETHAPMEASDAGYAARIMLNLLKPMIERPLPNGPAETSALGWRTGEAFYLRFGDVVQRLKAQIHPFKPGIALEALKQIGEYQSLTHRYPNGETEQVIVLSLRSARPRLHSLPALPPPSSQPSA
jgi:hypothetical protein